MTLEEIEKKIITEQLENCKNKALIARNLGITNKTLYNKIYKYKLEKYIRKDEYTNILFKKGASDEKAS